MNPVLLDLFVGFEIGQRTAQLDQVPALLLPIAEELKLFQYFVDGDCTEHVKPLEDGSRAGRLPQYMEVGRSQPRGDTGLA